MNRILVEWRHLRVEEGALGRIALSLDLTWASHPFGGLRHINNSLNTEIAPT